MKTENMNVVTPSGLFMSSISTLIYTSALILCSTISIPFYLRDSLESEKKYLFKMIQDLCQLLFPLLALS